MVNMEDRLTEIKKLVDEKKYFVMNRARQYGKTTTLNLLVKYLSNQYTVFFISFEGLGNTAFHEESAFCNTVCSLLYDTVHYGEVPSLEEPVKKFILEAEKNGDIGHMPQLSHFISDLCQSAVKPVILMVDETDQASNHKVFLDFLGMLRSKYLKRITRPTFQSVILAGVYDIKNLKQRVREGTERLFNSPWNIAADFRVDMSFTAADIAGMLEEYAEDKKYNMSVQESADEIYRYTSGYPYLVSKICKSIDDTCEHQPFGECWSRQGVSEAVKTLLKEADILFDDIKKQISDYPELKKMLYAILFRGETYPYNPDHFAIDIGTMFGFIKEQNGQVVISNCIFETRLYNLFLSEELIDNITYQPGCHGKISL